MQQKPKSLKLNAFLNTTKTVVGMLLSLLTYPYVARILSIESLGAYNFSYSIVSYAVLFAGLGISGYAIREGTKIKDNKDKFKTFVNEVFSINVVSSLISYALLFLCLFIPFFSKYKFLILILSTEIICTTIGASWLCNIHEDFLYITIRTLAFQIAYLVLLFIFVRSASDIYKYAAITCVSSCGANVLNFFYCRKKYTSFNFTFHLNAKKHLKPILVLFSTKVAITLYMNSDKTILGLLTNDYEVGLYSAAIKIYSIAKEVLAAMVIILVPRFVYILSKNNQKESNELFSKALVTLSLILLPASVGLILLSKEAIVIVAGDSYAPAATSLTILSFAIVFSLYSNLLTTCILVPKNKEWKVFLATIVSAVVNVAFNFVLIPFFGIEAAAITTLTAELIVFVMSAYFSRKDIKIVGARNDMFSIVLSCALIILVCNKCSELISNLYVKTFVSIILSAFIYFASLLLFKNTVAVDFFKKMFRKRNKNNVSSSCS